MSNRVRRGQETIREPAMHSDEVSVCQGSVAAVEYTRPERLVSSGYRSFRRSLVLVPDLNSCFHQERSLRKESRAAACSQKQSSVEFSDQVINVLYEIGRQLRSVSLPRIST